MSTYISLGKAIAISLYFSRNCPRCCFVNWRRPTLGSIVDIQECKLMNFNIPELAELQLRRSYGDEQAVTIEVSDSDAPFNGSVIIDL